MSKQYERKDKEYLEAKKSGVRSRAYYKLEELDKKHKLIKHGSKIADLGAWPGSWLEYAAKKTGPKGLVVGIDLVAIDPLPQENVIVMQGDLYTEESIARLAAESSYGYDLVISDMSPKLSGIKVSDDARCAGIAELALYVGAKVIKPGGSLVIKVFKNSGTDQLINQNRRYFSSLKRVRLDTTRRSSNENYLVGFGFKNKNFLDEYC